MAKPDPAPQQDQNGGFRIFRGNSGPHDGIDRLPPPPPWRRFGPGGSVAAGRLGDRERAVAYRVDERIVDRVNAALHLRRPLLVTGKPGSGKTTLAFNIAYELGLEPVLRWPVNSRTTLRQGLYDYDAIARLQDAGLRRGWNAPQPPSAAANTREDDDEPPGIGRYIRLGPLGTALLPGSRPRVLLIDELDKSDIDLPNDLLNVLEEGGFGIPELERLPDDAPPVEVMTADEGGRATIRRGRVRCSDFPIMIITSNGEREFPPAFLRRCLRVMIEPPTAAQLADIVDAHFSPDDHAAAEGLISTFIARRELADLATDQLLNAVFLARSLSPETTRGELLDEILRPLNLKEP
ncbi:MoxR family ATPase [Actinomadura vinacea]|uniref:MoxR family ATPase n=1 Tax=Actinomadura vinacea TaxID=115336 RepID=A0ABN3I8K5_9ACTN